MQKSGAMEKEVISRTPETDTPTCDEKKIPNLNHWWTNKNQDLGGEELREM